MAMDSKTGSLFGLYNAGDPMNNPLRPNGGLSQISPYLNVDPTYLTSQPEFLTLEGASLKRGRFELAFSQIGACCMSGATIGGAQGLYKALADTSAVGVTGKVRRTQIINYVMKRGSAVANTLGTVAVMYSAFGFLLDKARGKEDGINTVCSATVTGLLYKSTAGLRKCAIGGLVGLALSSVVVALKSRDKIKEYAPMYN